MAQTATNQTAREQALARRRALTSKGKAALSGNSATRQQAATQANTAASTGMSATFTSSARAASRARREAMSTGGKTAISSHDRVRQAPMETTQQADSSEVTSDEPIYEQVTTTKSGCGCGCNGTKASCTEQQIAEATAPAANRVRVRRRQTNIRSAARAASLARREAMSTRGKAGISNGSMSEAQKARAANPGISSRELAMSLRQERSRNGKTGQKKSEPCGRTRPNVKTGKGASDATWRVGSSETAQGQSVSGTMVGRSQRVTGDEASTCRAITGTEYLGADIFREFCQAEPPASAGKIEISSTTRGNTVTGNRIGRGQNVTGNEPGTCKRVTGNEYVGAGQAESFCGSKPEASTSRITSSQTRKGKSLTGNNVGRSEKVTGDETGSERALTGTQYMQPGKGNAPAKVGSSATLRGGQISGTMIGRSERVTGDESGSCRNVTGDDYIGKEQFGSFCESIPNADDSKVGVSATLKGKSVTGTMTGRSGKVTGDEPGTCKAVTGTPYAGAEQYSGFCKPEEASFASARSQSLHRTTGAVMTGLQPSVGGKMTGDQKGACETVSGTPYVGADQFAQACPATAADTNSPDFPQPLGDTPWGQFSVTSPASEASISADNTNVTGNRYEQGQITGPFGMAPGKVTGTEEARFGQAAKSSTASLPGPATIVEGRVKSRITGEGMDAGAKITGDDWDRGDNITGTEGTSVTVRNQTLAGSSMAMTAKTAQKRNDDLPMPTSKVTGGSGNTEKGSLVTYSGGARG